MRLKDLWPSHLTRSAICDYGGNFMADDNINCGVQRRKSIILIFGPSGLLLAALIQLQLGSSQ